VARPLFLVALPTSVVSFIALGGRQLTHIQAVEDEPHAGHTDGDIVIALPTHDDLASAEAVQGPVTAALGIERARGGRRLPLPRMT
jgi:hypothetical protein